MWLEYFGTVDERIFIGFGVVTGIICILTVVNSLLTCFQKERPPGHSVAQCLLYSMVVISASVLFRGVQPSWTSLTALRPLCPIFTALMLIGYTTFAACVMAQSWALVIKHKWNAWRERKAIISVWTLLIIAGISVVVWVLLFRPEVSQINGNEPAMSVYNEEIFTCGGWKQFIWRVSFSVYFAFILLLSIISLPFHCTFRLTMTTDGALRVALLTIIVNSTLCVIAGLVVWYQLDRDLYTESYRYAIIGGLQLWMLVASQVSLFIVQIVTRCHQKSSLYSFQYEGMSFGEHSDKVSVSDGDGTLNVAMTANYYE